MKGWMWPAETLGQCPERAPSLPGSEGGRAGCPGPPAPCHRSWLALQSSLKNSRSRSIFRAFPRGLQPSLTVPIVPVPLAAGWDKASALQPVG